MTSHTKIPNTFAYTPRVRHLDKSDLGVDVIGDVHGCMEELVSLLTRAGYVITPYEADSDEPIYVLHHQFRRIVFVGDLTDRGPASDQVLRLVMGATLLGTASCVMGNHDWKLYRYLAGRPIEIANGLQSTLDQIAPYGDAFATRVRALYEAMPHQVSIPLVGEHPYGDADTLWIAHAAAKEHRQGLTDKDTFNTSVYGYPLQEVDADGRPMRTDWAAEYTGKNPVIHGHTMVKEPRLLNRVLCIDTGCVFGGRLTLYRADDQSFLYEGAVKDHSGENRTLE